MHDYKNWNKALCKELCEYMECFEHEPTVETLCIVEKLAKTIVKIQEMEAYDAMRDYIEEEFGYDSDTGEFRSRKGYGDWKMGGYYNAYVPGRMTRTEPYYHTTGRGDGMNGNRYGERSTDRSMYPYGEYGWMNAYDGDRSRMGDDRRYGDRDGRRDGDYMNAGRGRERGERRRDERGRYTERIYNMADDHDMKKGMKKLSEKQKDEWVQGLESEDGRTGEIFTKQEVESIARKNNVKFDDYDLSTLWAVTNSLYSDYCAVISKIPNANTPSTWVKMAVAFLDDSDSDLTPDQKAAAYFHNIVDAEGEDD